jgi:hypothetical protein
VNGGREGIGRLVITAPHPLPSSLHLPTRIILPDEMPLNDITQIYIHMLFEAVVSTSAPGQDDMGGGDNGAVSRSADSVLNLHYMDLSISGYRPTGLVYMPMKVGQVKLL